MSRLSPILGVVLLAVACEGPSSPPQAESSFEPSAPQTAMPTPILVAKSTPVERAKFPVIDIHFHARSLDTAAGYEDFARELDAVGVAAICNIDGGRSRSITDDIELSSSAPGRVAHFARLDAYPNAQVEVSARLQELGRQPYTTRRFLMRYQDRVLFGSDGAPGRDPDQFWRPHWRFFETDDEYFDHPAQMLSPLGAGLQGRWKIHGVFLLDDVLRKLYFENALRLVPGLRAAVDSGG